MGDQTLFGLSLKNFETAGFSFLVEILKVFLCWSPQIGFSDKPLKWMDWMFPKYLRVRRSFLVTDISLKFVLYSKKLTAGMDDMKQF